MKTSSTAAQYVLRMLGWHPIPKRNVLYFECPKLVEEEKEAEEKEDESLIKHPWLRNEFDKDLKVRFTRYGYFTDSFAYPAKYVLPKEVVRPKDNICPVCGTKLRIHKRKTRIFRFASEVLPEEKEVVGDATSQSAEIRNAVYPEFKKWLPRFLIKKDITARKPSLRITDPNGGQKFGDIEYKGEDIVVEFVSYSQTVQAGAGVQRVSIWCDEEPPFAFYEEQMGRLVAEDGDFVLTLTPANRMSWSYDEMFERGKIYVRTQTIIDFLKEKDKKEVKQIELTDSNQDIAVIQAATDDNPTLSKKAINTKFIYEDPDTTALRRYGIFRQTTGRIYNTMNYKVHVISRDKYFPDWMPDDWVHARSIDFHERNPWAIMWITISPYDEAFVYLEWSPSPSQWVNLSIAQEMASRSGMQRFVMNIIDPLANKIQTNTGVSVIQDLNRIFSGLRKKGDCSGGYWEPFDTKGLKGRDEVRKRLGNSLLVGKPFNNKVVKHGMTLRLPTLWILDSCPETAKSLKQWRYDDWAQSNDIVTKDKKETPSQKFSHFCTALEAVFKDNRFRARILSRGHKDRNYNYFQG